MAWQLVIYRIAFQNGINDLLYLRLDKRGHGRQYADKSRRQVHGCYIYEPSSTTHRRNVQFLRHKQLR
ncbi:MAG: hypothetical protein R3B84_01340 [Zavarzinella sp.]